LNRLTRWIVAIVLIVSGGFGVYHFLIGQMKPVSVYEVRVDEISPGTTISSEFFKEEQKYYGNFSDEDYVNNIDEVVGLQFKYTMTEGDYLRKSKLTDNYDKGDLIREALKPNEVEVSFDTDLSDAVGGEISVGDRINLTGVDRQSNGKKYRSITFLQNVLVSGFKNEQGEAISVYEDASQSGSLLPTTGFTNMKPASIIVVVDQRESAMIKNFEEITVDKCGLHYEPFEAEVVYNYFYELDNSNKEENDLPLSTIDKIEKGE